MSGLCGIVRWDRGPVEQDWVETMMAAAPWRGPDGCGLVMAGPTGVGYQSLQLTPESVGETAPVVHAPTGVVVAADLRLDNRDELPGARQSPGPSDTALVLAAYLEWGSGCAGRLLGDFAFAIWDPRDRSVLLARDAMGMRALFYHSVPNRVVWATEVKQILAAPGVERRPNEAAIAAHLAGSYLPRGMSYYEGIAQVAPGESMTVTSTGLRTRRHWSFDPGKRLRYRSEEEYDEQFRELLQRAVECRLRAVKPVAISLSGGMDSGCVASMAGWLYERALSRYTPPLRAYSWAFEELRQCDERAVSRLITDRYGIHAVDIPAESSWPLRDFPDHGPDQDDPLFNVYQVLFDDAADTAARAGVGLLVYGARGDLMVGESILDPPGLLRDRRLGALLHELGRLRDQQQISRSRVGWRYLARPMLGNLAFRLGIWPRRRAGLAAANPPPHVRRDFLERAYDPNYRPFSAGCRSPDRAVRARYRAVFTEIHMQAAVWLDRSCARYGLGYADAWSDLRIADFVLSIPQYVITRYGEPKRIARRAIRGIMPDTALAAVGKVIPLPLFELALRDRASATVTSLCTGMISAERGYVDERAYRCEMERLQRGEIGVFDMWTTLTLESWLRQYWG